MRLTGATILAVGLSLVWADGHAPGAEGSENPDARLVVLRNGEVLRGRVSEAGRRYFVSRPDSEIGVEKADVQFVCADFDEAYRRLLASGADRDSEHRLRLAQWCVRHELFVIAKTEIDVVERLRAGDPRVERLRKQCDAARRAIAPAPPTKSPRDTQVVSATTLDELTRSLPKGSFAEFATSVQPHLMNSCATTGCHGARAESSFRLLRVGGNRPPSRRATQRNLHAALQQVDRKRPESSPLVTIPAKPHGGLDSPAMASGSQHRKRLIAWIARVSTSPVATRPNSVARPRPESIRTMSDPPSVATFARPSAEGAAPNRIARKPSAPTDGVEDPFDPEPFNRRHHPHGPPRESTRRRRPADDRR